MRKAIWLLIALGMGAGGWFYPVSVSALSFLKEPLSDNAIPNAELKIDSQGNLHAVFINKNNEIEYATRSLNNWVIQRVEEGGVGVKAKWVALALDNSDGVHLAFFDPFSGQVKYAKKASAGWTILAVAPANNSQCRLACPGSGLAYLAFNSAAGTESPGRMFLACLDTAVPALNTLEEIDAGGNLGYNPCLALDAGGVPHLTYFDRNGDRLKYAYKGAGGWNVVSVDNVPLAGWQSTLILDRRGRPHIAYCDASLGELKYAYKDTYGWHISTLDGGGEVGQYPALACDSRGQLFLVYYDAARGNLKYVYKRNSRWVRGALGQPGTGGRYVTLADNDAGEVSMLYYTYDTITGDTKLYYGKAALPRVYLNNPVWLDRSNLKISWRAGSPEIRAYRIQYSLGFGWKTIVDNLAPDKREYTWLVPSEKPAKNRCRIKIWGQGARGIMLASDQSADFIISP